MMASTVLASFVLAPLFLCVDATLERVVLVSRHGIRERLVKHHTHLGEAGGTRIEGGPALTDDGLLHLSRVGAVLRELYLAPACASVGTCLADPDDDDGLDGHEIRAESSGLARTLGTANVLLQSLAPPPTASLHVQRPVPVYSQPDSSDYLLRGYAGGKCAAFTAAIRAWQTTAAYRAKEAESVSLRAEVAAVLLAAGRATDLELSVNPGTASRAVPLRDWWNAYDALATADAPLLPAATMRRAEALLAWLEAHKFGQAVGGSLCGGALLAAILDRLTAPLAGPGRSDGNAGSGPRLVFYSAHYPTLLCLLSSLGISADSGEAADSWLAEQLLGEGSVLAFELHLAGDGSTSVQLWLLNGTEVHRRE